MDIEKAIVILKDEDCFWNSPEKDILEAIKHILAEREADKKRIKELETIVESYNVFKNATMPENIDIVVMLKEDFLRNLGSSYIPVQKVKDKINEYIEQKLVELTKTGSYTQNEGTPEQERLNGMQRGAKDIKKILLEDK